MGGDYAATAPHYDKIHAHKDYEGECVALTERIRRRHPAADSLLDVACGTGRHVEYFKDAFDVQGLDASPEMLARARLRNPNVRFHCARMEAFSLDTTFDVITCLFSSIGYVRTLPRLRATIHCLIDHLNPGGILIIEPWFTPATWRSHTVHALLIDEPELKIARMSTSQVRGSQSTFDVHYLIGTPEGTRHAVEHHQLGLFRTEDLIHIAQGVGLSVAYDKHGLTGRGLLWGSLGEVDPSLA
ncbi:class I SAM-dependent methyltransferase [Candidatus Bipolaricaulota bacterium]|nr:class I SAM-dependent methyltransferase [Candidatus Bipolaricaulota bacterium]